MAQGEHNSKEGHVLTLGCFSNVDGLRLAQPVVAAASGGEYSLELYAIMTSKSGHQTDVYKPTALPLLTAKPSARKKARI